MANLINATVYQIDGNPQKVPTVVAFDTDKIRIQETTLSTIPAVNTFIEVQGEKLNSPVVKYFVNETISSLVTPANSGGTTLLQATVVAINENPFKTSLQMAFPANKVTVWEFINGDIQSFLQFNEDKFYATESKATLVAAANAGGGVETVTGFGVNNTDPLNPIVNSYGTENISATGTNLATAYLINKQSTIVLGVTNPLAGLKLPLVQGINNNYRIGNASGQTIIVYANTGYSLFVNGATVSSIQIPTSGYTYVFTRFGNGWTVSQEQVQVVPYKVYTALLTQSGEEDIMQIISGDIVVGVTYYISDSGGGDWTNVGAPNNNTGTYFVATGTVPNSWGDSGALDVNLGAPVVTVLENTIGDIWFTYGNIGNYSINANALFTNNKTAIFFGPYIDSEIVIRFGAEIQSESAITIGSAFSSGLADNIFINTPIEIRVYN